MSDDEKPSAVILIDRGRDRLGQSWWRNQSDLRMHGPFRTEAEAQRNSEIVTLGPECEIEHGGQWDPAWDSMQ